MTMTLDSNDRLLIDRLQDGIPLVPRPYALLARETGLGEGEIVRRIGCYLAEGLLSRFGPMFNADRMGGAFCLCAMHVPAKRFDEVAAKVNAMPQVAHNYEREHELNMWFVLATESLGEQDDVKHQIEEMTGIEVLMFPKEAEYFIGLRVPS